MRTRPDLAPLRPEDLHDYPPVRGELPRSTGPSADPTAGPTEPLVEHAGTGTLWVVAALLALGLLVVVLAVG